MGLIQSKYSIRVIKIIINVPNVPKISNIILNLNISLIKDISFKNEQTSVLW